ncbi:MAG: exonuclease subunit SbcD [Bacteroidales bacterium]|nr:exonuclease subunit SbcD [Bacteroidales bacterium]
MFKIFHTADWHLGRRLAGYDRTAEFEAFFVYIEKLIDERKPNALIISGDIFDTGNPANEVIRRYCALLINLHSKFPDLQIVIIGGNHDSPSFLNIHAEILSYFSAIVVGGVEYNNGEIDYQKLIRPITINGETVAIICPVPYLRSGDLRRIGENASIKDFYSEVYARAEALRGNNHIPIIATGHFTAAGSSYPDTPIVGGMAGEDADSFPPFDYIALGHIHRAQQCGGRNNIRYSGSPLTYSFSEVKYSKSITEVVFNGAEISSIETIEVPQTADLLIVPTKQGDIFEIQEACRNIDANKDLYLAINIKPEFRTPETKSRIINEFLVGKKAKFCSWHISRPKIEAQTSETQTVTAREFKNADPIDIISELYRIKTARNLDSKYIQMLKEIIDQPE